MVRAPMPPGNRHYCMVILENIFSTEGYPAGAGLRPARNYDITFEKRVSNRFEKHFFCHPERSEGSRAG
jgi:hypothetical protein